MGETTRWQRFRLWARYQWLRTQCRIHGGHERRGVWWGEGDFAGYECAHCGRPIDLIDVFGDEA